MSEFGVLRLDEALTMHFGRQDVRFRAVGRQRWPLARVDVTIGGRVQNCCGGYEADEPAEL